MQKNTHFTRIVIFMLLAIFFVIYSCKKDDDPEKRDEVKYKGDNYEISKAKVVSLGYYNFILGLSSDNADFTATAVETSFTITPSGNGNLVLFQLIGNAADELSSGTYSFNATSQASPMTFVNSWLYFEYDFTNGSGTSTYVTSGTVTLTFNNSTVEVEIDASTPSGDKVTGYYKGLIVFE